ncbi:hypothetical protein PG995_015514 [Apiospora arundinis]
MTSAQYNRMRGFLTRLNRLPPSNQVSEDDHYFKESQISEALNAYNLHERQRECQPWALFHYFGLNSSVVVPRDPDDNFDWDELRHKTLLSESTGSSLLRELERPWPSAMNMGGQWRYLPNDPHYRLLCWMHRHEPPGLLPAQALTSQEVVYTMSVWDREDNIIYFHDPWGSDEESSTQRLADIRTFWRNILPQNQPPYHYPGDHDDEFNIRHVRYHTLSRMRRTTHPGLQPKFSQISCVAIGAWLANRVTLQAPLIPTDRQDILDGSYAFLFPRLSMTIFRTLREAENSLRKGIHGDHPGAQDYVEEHFRVNPNNIRMERHLRVELRAVYGNTPSRWIIDRITA